MIVIYFSNFSKKIVIVSIPFPATTVVYIYSERIDPEDSVSMPAKKKQLTNTVSHFKNKANMELEKGLDYTTFSNPS